MDTKCLLKYTDVDGVQNSMDQELITRSSCFSVDADDIGKCKVIIIRSINS